MCRGRRRRHSAPPTSATNQDDSEEVTWRPEALTPPGRSGSSAPIHSPSTARRPHRLDGVTIDLDLRLARWPSGSLADEARKPFSIRAGSGRAASRERTDVLRSDPVASRRGPDRSALPCTVLRGESDRPRRVGHRLGQPPPWAPSGRGLIAMTSVDRPAPRRSRRSASTNSRSQLRRRLGRQAFRTRGSPWAQYVGAAERSRCDGPSTSHAATAPPCHLSCTDDRTSRYGRLP